MKCLIPKLDVVFVLDTSASIKTEQNFGIMTDFVKNTAEVINININKSLAAVILFAEHASIRFSLAEYTDINNFQEAVESIQFKKVRQRGTNTPDALKLLRIAGRNGRLGLRNDTVKVGIVITDGRPSLDHLNISHDQAEVDTKKTATRLHNSGIYDQIYSVGIEGRRPIGKVLDYIAYPSSLVYHIDGFNATQFQQLTENFTLSFCNGE